MDALVDLDRHRSRLVRLLALVQLAVAPLLLLISLASGSGVAFMPLQAMAQRRPDFVRTTKPLNSAT